MSAKLHPIQHDNKSKCWCGPAALATVTGKPTSYTTALLRDVRRGKPVKGVYITELQMAFRTLGYRVESLPVSHLVDNLAPKPRRPTLARWLKASMNQFAQHPVIICTGSHFVTVLGRKFCDNFTKSPVFLKSAPHRRSRVQAAFRVVKALETAWTPAAIPARNYEAEKARRGVLQLANQFGISVEEYVHPGEWWVYPPGQFVDGGLVDPYYDNHLAFNADERAERVRKYVELIQAGNLQQAAKPVEVAA